MHRGGQRMSTVMSCACGDTQTPTDHASDRSGTDSIEAAPLESAVTSTSGISGQFQDGSDITRYIQFLYLSTSELHRGCRAMDCYFNVY
jgi:hypothetical protein